MVWGTEKLEGVRDDEICAVRGGGQLKNTETQTEKYEEEETLFDNIICYIFILFQCRIYISL